MAKKVLNQETGKPYRYKINYSKRGLGIDYGDTIKIIEILIKNKLNRNTEVSAFVSIHNDYINPNKTIWNGRVWRHYRTYEYRINTETNRLNLVKLDTKGLDYKVKQ